MFQESVEVVQTADLRVSGSSLYFPSLDRSQSANYSCTAVNELGTAESLPISLTAACKSSRSTMSNSGDCPIAFYLLFQ